MEAPDQLAAGINGFLADHHVQRSSRMTYESRFHDSSGPNYYASSLMLSDDGSVEPRHSRTPSRYSNAPTSAGGHTYVSSCFSSTRTVTTMSDAPSIRGHGPAAHRLREPVPAPSNLVCEFVRFGMCNQMFDIDNVDGWIEHIATMHLGGKFPHACVCWFCDHADFDPRSNSQADRARCYRVRMQHIARHFRNGVTQGDMRSDFHFLNHVHNAGLISGEMFQSELRHHQRRLHPISQRRGNRATVDVQVELNHSHRRPSISSRPVRQILV